jgi:hypothetical protein
MLSRNLMKMNRKEVQILATGGKCWQGFLDLYCSGPVLTEKSRPKIWYMKSKIS